MTSYISHLTSLGLVVFDHLENIYLPCLLIQFHVRSCRTPGVKEITKQKEKKIPELCMNEIK